MVNFLRKLAHKIIYSSQNIYFFYIWLLSKKRDPIVQEANDPDIVMRQSLDQVHILKPLSGKYKNRFLPKDLILSPGNYKFGEKIYKCESPGIYRFITPQQKNLQHIVIDEEDGVKNAILFSFLSIRGNRDNWSLIKTLEQQAIYRFLSLTCWLNASFCDHLLKKNNFNSRMVFTTTLKKQNSFSNGHVLLEIFSNKLKKYVCIDVDKKAIFLDQSKPLSLFEYSQALNKKKKITMKLFSPYFLCDWNNFIEAKTNFHYGFIEYLINSSSEAIENSQARICQIPYMQYHGTVTACAWDLKARQDLQRSNPKWEVLLPKEYVLRYYSDQHICYDVSN